MRKVNNSHLIKVLFVLTFIFILTSIHIVFFQTPAGLIQSKEINISFIVVSDRVIGFDVSGESLTFGIVGQGGGGERSVRIDNNREYPIEGFVYLTSELVPLIDVNSTFVVPPSSNYTLDFSLVIPEDYPLGNYSGKVKIDLYSYTQE